MPNRCSLTSAKVVTDQVRGSIDRLSFNLNPVVSLPGTAPVLMLKGRFLSRQWLTAVTAESFLAFEHCGYAVPVDLLPGPGFQIADFPATPEFIDSGSLDPARLAVLLQTADVLQAFGNINRSRAHP